MKTIIFFLVVTISMVASIITRPHYDKNSIVFLSGICTDMNASNEIRLEKNAFKIMEVKPDKLIGFSFNRKPVYCDKTKIKYYKVTSATNFSELQ